MKQSNEIIEKRRNAILVIINEHKELSNVDLAKMVDVSLPTIRRDINYLEKKGLIKKYHGRVCSIGTDELRSSIIEKKQNIIAKTAASLVDNDDIIFINSSKTSIKTIEYIEPSTYVSVITNNGKALSLHVLPNVKLVLTGGETKAPKSAMTGEFALKNIINVQANKAILGASGFHIAEGMTTANLDEVAINKYMIQNTNTVILCIDSSKLNHKSAFISSEVTDIDIIITDSDADQKLIEQFEMLGIKCIVVDYE